MTRKPTSGIACLTNVGLLDKLKEVAKKAVDTAKKVAKGAAEEVVSHMPKKVVWWVEEQTGKDLNKDNAVGEPLPIFKKPDVKAVEKAKTPAQIIKLAKKVSTPETELGKRKVEVVKRTQKEIISSVKKALEERSRVEKGLKSAKEQVTSVISSASSARKFYEEKLQEVAKMAGIKSLAGETPETIARKLRERGYEYELQLASGEVLKGAEAIRYLIHGKYEAWGAEVEARKSLQKISELLGKLPSEREIWKSAPSGISVLEYGEKRGYWEHVMKDVKELEAALGKTKISQFSRRIQEAGWKAGERLQELGSKAGKALGRYVENVASRFGVKRPLSKLAGRFAEGIPEGFVGVPAFFVQSLSSAPLAFEMLAKNARAFGAFLKKGVKLQAASMLGSAIENPAKFAGNIAGGVLFGETVAYGLRTLARKTAIKTTRLKAKSATVVRSGSDIITVGKKGKATGYTIVEHALGKEVYPVEADFSFYGDVTEGFAKVGAKTFVGSYGRGDITTIVKVTGKKGARIFIKDKEAPDVDFISENLVEVPPLVEDLGKFKVSFTAKGVDTRILGLESGATSVGTNLMFTIDSRSAGLGAKLVEVYKGGLRKAIVAEKEAVFSSPEVDVGKLFGRDYRNVEIFFKEVGRKGKRNVIMELYGGKKAKSAGLSHSASGKGVVIQENMKLEQKANFADSQALLKLVGDIESAVEKVFTGELKRKFAFLKSIGATIGSLKRPNFNAPNFPKFSEFKDLEKLEKERVKQIVRAFESQASLAKQVNIQVEKSNFKEIERQKNEPFDFEIPEFSTKQAEKVMFPEISVPKIKEVEKLKIVVPEIEEFEFEQPKFEEPSRLLATGTSKSGKRKSRGKRRLREKSARTKVEPLPRIDPLYQVLTGVKMSKSLVEAWRKLFRIEPLISGVIPEALPKRKRRRR